MSSKISRKLSKHRLENVKSNKKITHNSIDPFYSESNIKYLEKIVLDIKNGKAKFEAHELIEVDNDC